MVESNNPLPVKIIFILIDGIADLNNKELNGIFDKTQNLLL